MSSSLPAAFLMPARTICPHGDQDSPRPLLDRYSSVLCFVILCLQLSCCSSPSPLHLKRCSAFSLLHLKQCSAFSLLHDKLYGLITSALRISRRGQRTPPNLKELPLLKLRHHTPLKLSSLGYLFGPCFFNDLDPALSLLSLKLDGIIHDFRLQTARK